MGQMIEVTKEYFHKTIHPLNVHVNSRETYTEWKLNGNEIIAKSIPGYGNYYQDDGKLLPEKYFVVLAHAPK